jgi:DNA-binding transcriptional MerR regulator
LPDRAHLSIGEVLSLLQDEFPDVTISKIRFLESQGLIDPERTPSGYRKFYEGDIDTLRWILRQQRENFLPLKVIKDRLDEHGGHVPPDDDSDAAPAGPRAGAAAGLSGAGGAILTAGGSLPFSPQVELATVPAPGQATAPSQATPAPVWMEDHARQVASKVVVPPAPEPAGAPPTPEPVSPPPARVPAPPAAAASSAPVSGATGPLDGSVTDASLNVEELLGITGLTAAQLRSLEQYGLVRGRQVGPEVLYDGDAIVVAHKAAAFLAHGIEARHLRMFKVSAEREAGFLEQVVAPLLKQRNPASRQQALALLQDLIGLGEAMHGGLLRQALRDYLHPPN